MSTMTLDPAPTARAAGETRLRALVRGRAEDPAWVRPALVALLAATTVAYLINLTASGDANSFYAAAVQAGTKSWKAFFFGSLDSSSFITVDKPPASLWVMDLSGRIFGFSSASMLIPQVLEGVLSVGLLAAAVRRWFGPAAGLIAGAALALTPVAALMFRFNNPDALMVCLLVASAYCLVRALESASTRWLLGVGALIGFAFLAKMMEAFLVIPGFALVYLVAAPTPVRRRVIQLLAGGAMMLASCGWWVATVALWPASSRPMIDGSPDNSILNLIFDYNGFGRLTGSGGGPGGGGGANFSGSTGLFRLFNDLMGGQASWLLPAALLVTVAGIAWRGRAARTDRVRAALMIWGSWLLVSAIVFSFSAGTIHTYYTVALAPAIAALIGIGAVLAWRQREHLVARGLAAVAVAMTAAWAVVLLQRSSSWESWLTPLIIVTGLIAVAGILASPRLQRRLGAAVAVAAAVACLAAPAAYTAETISTAHTGSIPTAGPATSGGRGGVGGGFGRVGGGFGRAGGAGGAGGFAGLGGATGAPPGAPTGATGTSGAGTAARTFTPGAGGGGATTSSAMVKLLETGAKNYRWVAATDGSQSAATLELATNGDPIMAIGGFSGQGGNLSLSQFESYVKQGDIHYYIAGAGGGFGGFGGAIGGTAHSTAGSTGLGSLFGSGTGSSGTGSSGTGSSGTGSSSTGTGNTGAPGGTRPTGGFGGGVGGRSSSDSEILTWVKAHYHSETVGGETVYNLSDPLS